MASASENREECQPLGELSSRALKDQHDCAPSRATLIGSNEAFRTKREKFILERNITWLQTILSKFRIEQVRVKLSRCVELMPTARCSPFPKIHQRSWWIVHTQRRVLRQRSRIMKNIHQLRWWDFGNRGAGGDSRRVG